MIIIIIVRGWGLCVRVAFIVGPAPIYMGEQWMIIISGIVSLALLLSRTLGRAPPPPTTSPRPPHTTNTLSLTLNTSRFILSSRFYHPFPVVSGTLSASDVICLKVKTDCWKINVLDTLYSC